MSAERIDYAACALRSLDAAWDGPAPKEQYFLTEAQVHATLAVAEQQRLANLIALVAVPADHFESLDRHPSVYDEIREGLGL